MIPGTYGKRHLWFTRAEYRGRVCPTCEGRKTPNSGLCYRCAAIASGHVAKLPGGLTNIGGRALRALFRYRAFQSGYKYPGDDPSDWRDEASLLDYASQLTDHELQSMRNVGRKTIEWIRANQRPLNQPDQWWSEWARLARKRRCAA